MSQADRLAVIARLLEHGQTVTTQSLQERFEVSRATIMRDIAFLRDRNGMPVAYEPQARGFKIVRADRFGKDVIATPGLWLTQEEAYALLTLCNITRQIDPGIFSDFVAPMRGPIKRVLVDAGYQMLGIDRKVRIEIPFGEKFPYSIFSPIGYALLYDKSLYIEANNKDGREFAAVCFPRAVVLTLGGWVVEVMPENAIGNEVIAIPLSSVQIARVSKDAVV
ncbi:MAG: HTH domain-containing protein [Burkholderiaceae bacterium]|nr:MAG: HTH domain-containing protein [Burkholderiaceae bacterium]